MMKGIRKEGENGETRREKGRKRGRKNQEGEKVRQNLILTGKIYVPPICAVGNFGKKGVGKEYDLWGKYIYPC